MNPNEEQIRALLEAKSETPNRDYKQSLTWNRENRESCLEVIKDILAMANTRDGGKIVFGVEDGTFDFIGLSQSDYDSFDVTNVNQLLHEFADPKFMSSVIKRIIDGKRVVVIDVPEFKEIPIICKAVAHNKAGKVVLIKGGVYIRTEKCSSEPISSADEMRSILGIGITRKSDELLGLIRKLMSGQPLKPNPEALVDYKSEIEEADKFFEEKLDSKFGYWEVTAYPTIYNPNLISNPVEAGNIVKDSIVHLRGWDFPHEDNHGNVNNFLNGRQSFTVSKSWPHQEAWRMYKSGLFIWKEYFGEDMLGHKDEGQNILYFVSTIYSLTEFMLFFKRLYSEKLKVDTVHLKITLKGCKGRRLASSNMLTLLGDYVCSEDLIAVERDIQTIDLTASFESIARTLIKEIFMIFNWNDPKESMLEGWQRKLLESGGI